MPSICSKVPPPKSAAEGGTAAPIALALLTSPAAPKDTVTPKQKVSITAASSEHARLIPVRWRHYYVRLQCLREIGELSLAKNAWLDCYRQQTPLIGLILMLPLYVCLYLCVYMYVYICVYILTVMQKTKRMKCLILFSFLLCEFAMLQCNRRFNCFECIVRAYKI